MNRTVGNKGLTTVTAPTITSTLLVMYDKLYAALGPQHWWPGETRTEVIVGAVLTQNTAWRNVERAIERLKTAGRLSLPALRDIGTSELAGLIRPAGTFRVKAKRLKTLVAWLYQNYDGDLDIMFSAGPKRLREGLLGVHGIGPETADAIILYAGFIGTFVIDAYTRRILRRHFLIHDGATYAETKKVFEAHLPANAAMFGEFHALLVAVGKRFCRPKARCDTCPLRDLEHDAGR